MLCDNNSESLKRRHVSKVFIVKHLTGQFLLIKVMLYDKRRVHLQEAQGN